jgi:Ca-activated chloride channel family protein
VNDIFRHAFAHPWLLLALTSLVLLAALGWWDQRQRRGALIRFGPMALAGAQRDRGRLRGWCITLGLLCVGIGLAGPQWGRDPGQATAPGRDLLVVLDCSRSMFAESPSRLERARSALLDIAATLRQQTGTRVGLVTFAARARIACPLTHDLDHFREVVAGLDLAAPDPDLDSEEAVSGTRIGLGLELAVELHDGPVAGARDIILLSDGDDPARDGEWRRGIARAREQKIPVHCIGIGDPNAPHPLLLGPNRTPLLFNGKAVTTRLEEAPLQEIARLTGGRFLSADTRSLALGDYYLDIVASGPVREDAADPLPIHRQQPEWFLLAGFVLFSLSLLVPDRARFRKVRP